jgi:hypothetical protein
VSKKGLFLFPGFTAFSAFLAFMALLALQAGLHRKLAASTPKFTIPPAQAEAGAELNGKLVKGLFLGFSTSAADIALIRALSETELGPVAKGFHPPSYLAYQLATQLDPSFFEIYWAAGNYLSVVRQDPIGALHFVRRGIDFITHELPQQPSTVRERYWSRAWAIYLIGAYLSFYDFQDIEMGCRMVEDASKIPGSPDYLKGFAQKLRQPEERRKFEEFFLNLLLRNERREDVRKRISDRLQALRKTPLETRSDTPSENK